MLSGRFRYFFTTLRELTPYGGVSIRASRTDRRLMNSLYGNHGNVMYHLFLWQPFKLVRCVSGERLHRLRCFLEALVFHFINDFVKVARRYCLVIVEDNKEEGRLPWSSFVVRQKACCSLTARFYALTIRFALRSFINHLWCPEYLSL